MKSVRHLVICLILCVCLVEASNSSSSSCVPTQIHISLGDEYYNNIYYYNMEASKDNSNGSVIIAWQTQSYCPNVTVAINGSALGAQPYFSAFSSPSHQSVNLEGYNSTAYFLSVPDLSTGYSYSYTITQEGNKEGPFNFEIADPSYKSETVSVLIYSSIDTNIGNQTINAFKNMEQNGTSFDAQLCLGNIGNSINTYAGYWGEYFFNSMQSVSSSWPFMITPGVIEQADNYEFFDFRVQMPYFKTGNNQFYSFTLGKIHFLAVNYEFYNLNPSEQNETRAWIISDLTNANNSRFHIPWIVVYTQYPIYCSYNSPTNSNYNCSEFYNKFEVFDGLWNEFKVDIVLQGHINYWERMGPIYKNNLEDFVTWPGDVRNNSIINPTAPIYTIDASAGNSEMVPSVPTVLRNYSFNANVEVGFSTLTYINQSALLYQHFSSANSEQIDYFYLLKGNQYPYPGQPLIQPDGSRSVFAIILSTLIIFGIGGFVLFLGKQGHKEINEGVIGLTSYADI